MYVLGIWDGHDAGACIVEDGRIKVAINEERLSRRKLDVGFPHRSIKACLEFLKLKPADIEIIAATTSDFSKTLTRVFPSLKERYYLFRRRKVDKPRFTRFQHFLKYKTTQYGDCYGFCRGISSYYIKRHLNSMGFSGYKLHMVDHHLAHAASACYTSGFKKALCITLDGVGDGLSGSVNIFEDGEIERISSINARDSLGIFFEQVTNIIGFRELEDEGKVMCMADYSYPLPDEKNRFIDFFSVDGLGIKAKHSASRAYKLIDRVAWNTPREQVAYMAQRTLEKNMAELFSNAMKETGIKDVCWSGGIASNVKANMKVRMLEGLKEWYVFPHMGDGGLAAGAALFISAQFGGKAYRMNDAYFGPDFSEDEIRAALKKHKGMKYEQRSDIARHAGDLLARGNYLFWFQGRMEFGPRALGNRSIVASASSEEIKDRLNVDVKQREWYQPFCPSMLQEEAKKFFVDVKGFDRFMTMAYMTNSKMIKRARNVINIDGSSRPQMLGDENKRYRSLMEQVKKRTGDGVILNTSFNIHGEPIVCNPAEAISTMIRTKTRYMVLGDFLVTRN